MKNFIKYVICLLFFNSSFSQTNDISKNSPKKELQKNQVELNATLIKIDDYIKLGKQEKKAISLNKLNEPTNINEESEEKTCVKVENLANYNFSKKEIHVLNKNEKKQSYNEMVLQPVSLVLLKKED